MIGDTLICVRLSFFCSLAQLRLGRLWSLFEEEEECSFLPVIIPTSSHLKLCEIFNVGNSTTHCSWQDGWIHLLLGTGWLKILIYYCLYIYGSKCKRLLLKHTYIIYICFINILVTIYYLSQYAYNWYWFLNSYTMWWIQPLSTTPLRSFDTFK